MSAWPLRSLRSLSKVPLHNGLGESAQAFDPNLPRYIRITDLSERNGLREDTVASLPHEVARDALLEENDVLLTAVGATVGKAYLHRRTSWPGPACFAGYLVRLTPVADVDPNFLLYWCQSSAYWDQVRASATKATVENLSARRFSRFHLRLPCKERQISIVDFLDRETARIDTLIEKQEKLIETLRERRAAAIELEINDDCYLAPVRAITHLIQTGPFGSQLKSDEYVSGGVPVINPSHIADGRIAADPQVAVTAQKADDLVRHRLEQGDVVASRRGELGRCAVVRSADEGYLCGTGSVLVRPNDRKINPNFLAIAFASRRSRDQLSLASVGSTMENLNATIVGALKLPCPPIDVQTNILDRIEKSTQRVDALIHKARRFIELAKERRSALITAAVTGQIEVGEEAPVG